MYEIVNVHEYSGGLEACVTYIHSKWGGSDNYLYFFDAIVNSSLKQDHLPQFYVLVIQKQIVGCYGIIINDFISRHDLYPWFSSLFIEVEHRGKRLSELMFEHAKKQVMAMGYANLYLTTDHVGFYEKFGWKRLNDGYEPSGERTKIYKQSLINI
ncbi:GNAT family N-acetyltransferase [Zooshikella marina]|uniref:GNAT family N-acetyltransferase n=1 Tax=Zooshikella ganghwensis TaxID=202772 RepID=UPI001BB03DB6|nr:GNAT family N-acetyltransferase [Zooshikella ganghwensis]MBU2706995.1 GNAT family N-acetyltransferase [Zooshikella ganghwensis]